MGTRAGLSSILIIAMALTAPLSAQKGNNPPYGGPPPDDSVGVVTFTVSLPEDALTLESMPVAGEPDLAITRVNLDLPDAATFSIGSPGEALLPAVQKLVALPRGAVVTELNVTPTLTRTFDGVTLLEWAQLPRPGQSSKQKRDWIPPSVTIIDNEIVFYGADSAFPPSPAYLQTEVWPAEATTITGNLGGDAANVIQIDIAPVHWYPQDQKLVYDLSQQIEVHYEIPKQQPHFKPLYGDVNTVDDLRNEVVNPSLLPPLEIPLIQKIDAPYLIITDNYEWNEDKTRGAALDGNLVAELRRLANWKTRRGIRAKVVTVSEIVNGSYGSFSRDAADLQETIREFLKHARAQWNTYWVLLGGDETIIPLRVVLSNAYANAAHAILMLPEQEPPKGRAYFDGDTGRVRMHYEGITTDQLIYAARDSIPFEYVGWPTVRNPGWGYATSETYRSPSLVPTEYIVIHAPRTQIEGTHFYLDLQENRIATDLYYASVDDPLYDAPGRDWDANGDGNYGQHYQGRTIDGVSFEPDLAVGRVPGASGPEMRWWVERTLEYEKGEFAPDFPRKLLLAGDNWGATGPAATFIPSWSDLVVGNYQIDRSTEGFSRARIFFLGSVVDPADWTLVFSETAGSFSIPYDRNASSTRAGYYFNTDETFTARSETELTFLGLHFYIPVPTRFVSVYAPYDRIDNGRFFFDNFEPDGVIEHKERIGSVLTSALPALTDLTRRYRDWYDFPGGDPSIALTDSSVERALQAGQNLVSVAGHGSPGGCCGLTWYSMISFRSSGVLYADSCLTGKFTESRESLAENLMVGSVDGVSAYLGNTALSWIGMGNDVEAAFWERLRRNPSLSALHHTKATFQRYDTNLWTNYAMTLFGDPELRIWRQPPLELLVEVPATITPGTRLSVRVTNDAGAPLPLATVAMTGDNVFETALTDLSGHASFAPVVSPGTIFVAVAPSGYLPVERAVRVAP